MNDAMKVLRIDTYFDGSHGEWCSNSDGDSIAGNTEGGQDD